ncbi:MAG: hypothetical protein GX493_01565 [Firmicutes bacterium]|nr:hypothetical protein [Bacillota bacterium]
MAIIPEMPHYLEAFLIEAGEELGRLENCLGRLRKEGARLPIVEEALHAAANLKVAAATMGFRSIRDLAHAISDMLQAWRRGGVRDPETSLALLDRAHARLREFLAILVEGRGPEPSVIDLTLQLRALVTKEAENPWPETEPEPTILPEHTEDRFIVELGLEVPCPHPMGRFLVCQGYLLELGRVVASDPPPTSNQRAENGLDFRFLLATQKEAAEIKRVLEAIPYVRRIEVIPAPPEIDTLPPPTEKKRKKERVFAEWTVRIGAEQLDELGAIVAELVELRSAYRALEREAERLHPGLGLRLVRLGERTDYSLARLSEALAPFRWFPAEILLERLARWAEERAKALGKEAETKILGGELPVSLAQAEAIFPHLQQLVEVILAESSLPPDERVDAGKKRANRLEFTVRREEAKLTLGLADDGVGLPVEEGFRRGRLAEIRQALEACGAMVDGQSGPGQGTIIQVELSLLGMYFDVLAVEAGRDLYALPLAEVVEARRAAEEAVVHIDGQDYLPQDRLMLPLFDLVTLLGRPGGMKGNFWIFIRSQERPYILRVPGILGARRVIARPTPSGLKIPGLRGSCLDGEGRTYYLLSPGELVRSFMPTDKTGKEKGHREAKR